MELSIGLLSYELEVAYNIVVLKYTVEAHSRMDHLQLPADTRRHVHAQTRVSTDHSLPYTYSHTHPNSSTHSNPKHDFTPSACRVQSY